MSLAENFPWNTPNNTDSIQQLLYRLAMIATVEGAATSPGVRGWGAFQQTIAAVPNYLNPGGYTTVKNIPCSRVLIMNNSGDAIQISQDGTNFCQLGPSGSVYDASQLMVDVNENAAEIQIKPSANNQALLIDFAWFT